jgi:hypothetical protein
MNADLAPRMTATDARRLRSELSADDRAWRAGFEAGRRDRWWRKVPMTAWVVGGLVALWALSLRRPHPLAFLFAFLATFAALLLLPVFVVIHGFHGIIFDRRVHHSNERTVVLCSAWGFAVLGVILVFITNSVWPLLLPVLAFGGWQVFSPWERHSRGLYRPPVDEPALTDADRRPGLPTPADHRNER